MKKIIKYYLTIIVIIVLTFLTGCKKEEVPVITTTAVSNITATTATSGGNITDEGSSTVITRGVCWSTGLTPTIADSKTTDAAGAGSFSSNIIDLFGGTTYYVRAYAMNSSGTGYGMALSFKTTGQPPSAPTVTTQNATSIQTSSAQLNGTVNAMYYSTVVTFEYGTTTSYGSTSTATQSPATGGTNTIVSANITGLTVATIYHYRIKAVNSLGTTYSTDLTFTTLGAVPTASTTAITIITTTGAIVNGIVNANYLSTTVSFEYGLTTGYGNTATATPSTVTGNTSTNVSTSLTGLTVGTNYHYRVVSTNSLGTTNGNDMTFTTAPATVNDVDGNTYNVVAIGAQVWMKENLNTTKYNDGTAIPNVTDNTAWTVLITGAYSDYNNTPSNSTTYGRLYNWYAVDNNATTRVASNGSKNVCPTSWHIPSDAEWTTLTTYLGNDGAGGKLKETGTTHWITPNTGATNETGFTALPGGLRGFDGIYVNIGNYGSWWSSTESSTEYSTNYAWFRYMGDFDYVDWKYFDKQYGFSVRCLHDN